MTVKTFGYIRVSSKDQNEARQVDKLLALGVAEKDLFVDKASGKNTDRPQYQALKSIVRAGDTVVFESITRLSRNMTDVKDEYRWFTEQGVLLRFVAEPMLDTKTDDQGVIERAMTEIILTLLAAFAEKERDEIKRRQKEGIESAKKRGQSFGRPKRSFATMTAVERQAFIYEYNEWKAERQTAVQTFTRLEIPKATFYKIVKEYEQTAIN